MFRKRRAFSGAVDTLAPLTRDVREDLLLTIVLAFDGYTREQTTGYGEDFKDVLWALVSELRKNNDSFRQLVQNLYAAARETQSPEEVFRGGYKAVVDEIVVPAIEGGRLEPLSKVRHTFLYLLEEAVQQTAFDEINSVFRK